MKDRYSINARKEQGDYVFYVVDAKTGEENGPYKYQDQAKAAIAEFEEDDELFE